MKLQEKCSTGYPEKMGIKEFIRSEGAADKERRIFALDRSFSDADAEHLPERRNDLNERPFLLKIFHINDLHCNICTFNDDYSSLPVFSKIVNAVEKDRKNIKDRDETGLLFLSAGDDSTGSPMDHLTGYDGEGFICHPVYSAFSIAGVDVTVLGNHDFDTGLQTLKKSIRNDASFPVLSANLQHNGELDSLVYPAAIIVIKRVRIGIIGLTTPGQVRSREGSIFSISSPLEAVEEFYNKLFPFCDSIIILSHLGYKMGSTFAAVKIMGDIELAAGLNDKNIDLIIGGHTHDLLNMNGIDPWNIVNNIPVLQAGFNGLFYGKTILRISNRNSLVQTSLLPTANLNSNKEFDFAYENTNAAQNIKLLRMSIGKSNLFDDYKLKNYELFKDSYENPMANFITDALAKIIRDTGQPIDLSLIDGSSMVRFFDPDQKNINIIDIYHLMPYADTIVLIEITGRVLLNIITENARRINKDNMPNFERGFLHFSKELRYKIYKNKSTARNITVNNTPLEGSDNAIFTLAMPNYVQGLSKVWEDSEAALGITISSLRDIPKKDTGKYVRNELLEYIKNYGISSKSGFLLDGRLEIN